MNMRNWSLRQQLLHGAFFLVVLQNKADINLKLARGYFFQRGDRTVMEIFGILNFTRRGVGCLPLFLLNYEILPLLSVL